MDGQQHEVECIWVQQCERYPSSSQQPLEARYPHVQQVSHNTRVFLPSAKAILVSRDLFSFGFWVSRVLHHQSARARSKPDTRHQHINLPYLASCWIITSIHRISNTWHLTSLQIPTMIDNYHWSIILVPAKLLTRPTQPTWWWLTRVSAPTFPLASSCRPVPLISPGSHLMTRIVIWSSVAGHITASRCLWGAGGQFPHLLVLVGLPARQWGWRRYSCLCSQWRMGVIRWDYHYCYHSSIKYVISLISFLSPPIFNIIYWIWNSLLLAQE